MFQNLLDCQEFGCETEPRKVLSRCHQDATTLNMFSLLLTPRRTIWENKRRASGWGAPLGARSITSVFPVYCGSGSHPVPETVLIGRDTLSRPWVGRLVHFPNCPPRGSVVCLAGLPVRLSYTPIFGLSNFRTSKNAVLGPRAWSSPATVPGRCPRAVLPPRLSTWHNGAT